MTRVVDVWARRPDSPLPICDFSPPRGASPELLDPAVNLDADFISVAYNPGRSARVISPMAAYWIRHHTGKEVLFTLATRDMNALALQSLLLGAELLDLENVVVVKGDPFSDRDLGVTNPVNDYSPTGLIASISAMNEGADLKGLKLRNPTSFCVGATLDLGRGIEAEAALTRRKIEAGAQYFLAQAVFDPAQARDFVDAYARRHGEELPVPVFYGIQVMAPDSVILSQVPEWVTEDLRRGRSGPDIAIQLIRDFRDEGFPSIYLVPPILKGGRRDYEAAQIVLESARP